MTKEPQPINTPPRRYRWLVVLAWILVIGGIGSLTWLNTLSLADINQDINMALFLSFSIAGGSLILIAIGVLSLGIYYRRSLRRLQSLIIVLILCLFSLSQLPNSVSYSTSSATNWLIPLTIAWLPALLLLLGLTLLFYTSYTHNAVTLFALSFLIVMWCLWILVTFYYSPQELLQNLVLLQVPMIVNLSICFLVYIFFIGPIAFVYHTFRLLILEFREQQ